MMAGSAKGSATPPEYGASMVEDAGDDLWVSKGKVSIGMVELSLVEALGAEAEALVPGAGGVTLKVLELVRQLAVRCDEMAAENADLRERLSWCEGEMAAAELLVSGAITEVSHLGLKILRLAGPPAP